MVGHSELLSADNLALLMVVKTDSEKAALTVAQKVELMEWLSADMMAARMGRMMVVHWD